MNLRNPITLVVEGDPPRKNERHRIAWDRKSEYRPRLVDTDDVKAWWSLLHIAWLRTRERPILSGVWAITVHAFWSRERHLEDMSFGIGDLDAPISAVLDGLQQIGAIDNDVRFDDGTLRRRHDKARPRVDITLTELAPDE